MSTTSTSLHTPGPWFHIPRARDGHADLITDRDGQRSRVFIQVGSPIAEKPILDYPHENVQTANARLIAAAPELIEALQNLVDFSLSVEAGKGDWTDALAKFVALKRAGRIAIDKATLSARPQG